MSKSAVKRAIRTADDLTPDERAEPCPTQRHLDSRSRFRDDILQGLRASPRRLSSLYFYDDQGSALFDEITRLPEYYLTRSEHSILRAHADDIADLVANNELHDDVCIVDLGAGSGEKTRCIVESLCKRGVDVVYAPLDVSQAALHSAQLSMRSKFPTLRVEAVKGEYVPGLARVRKEQAGRKLLVLWLGSSIGNLSNPDAADLLRQLSDQCADDDVFLIGFDLLKDPKALIAAYDDSRGVTAEFNYNLLRRINRELDGNFDVTAFAHYATFCPLQSRMESYLISRTRQTVTVAGVSFTLDAWEPIQTEISCKYSLPTIATLLQRAGLKSLATYTDADRQFADVACVRRDGHIPK